MSDGEYCEDGMATICEALRGTRGDGQRRIAFEIIRWGALLLRKNQGYGGAVWESPLLAPDCDPGVAIRVRMSDKLSRLIALLERPPEVADESIDDTLRDLGAYCLLELARPGRDRERRAKMSIREIAERAGIDITDTKGEDIDVLTGKRMHNE